AVHVSTGIPMIWSLVLTAVLLLVYLQGGGMWSIGLTQSINCCIFIVMLLLGLYAVLAGAGLSGLAELAAARPDYYAADTVGMTQIAAWFGTFIVNVPLAQATFQMAVSCRTPSEGRKGLYWACLFGVPFIIVATLLGLAAASAMPNAGKGLIAVPAYLEAVLPAPLVGVFFLGVWACALGWGVPVLRRNVPRARCHDGGASESQRNGPRALHALGVGCTDRPDGDLGGVALRAIGVVEHPGVDGTKLRDVCARHHRAPLARGHASGSARRDGDRLWHR